MLFPQLFLFLSRFPLYLANSSLPKNSGRFLLDTDSSSARWLDTSTRTVPTPAHSPGAQGQGTQGWFVLGLIMQRATLPLQDWEKPSVILQIIRWLCWFFSPTYIFSTP